MTVAGPTTHVERAGSDLSASEAIGNVVVLCRQRAGPRVSPHAVARRIDRRATHVTKRRTRMSSNIRAGHYPWSPPPLPGLLGSPSAEVLSSPSSPIAEAVLAIATPIAVAVTTTTTVAVATTIAAAAIIAVAAPIAVAGAITVAALASGISGVVAIAPVEHEKH